MGFVLDVIGTHHHRDQSWALNSNAGDDFLTNEEKIDTFII